MSKRKKIVIGVIAGVLAVVLAAGILFFRQMSRMMASMGPVEMTYAHQDHESGDGSVVYMTTDISPEGMMAIYQALNWTPAGNVAVKLSTGEPPASNYLRPELIADVVKAVGGTIVENNTAYGGSRAETAMHYQVAEAGKAVSDHLNNGENIVYISVMNRLSVDCDCNGNPAEPDMHDIGILASTDPVALDQACVDLVYHAPDGQSLVNRMESRNAEVVLEHGEEIGLGSRAYTIISLDR